MWSYLVGRNLCKLLVVVVVVGVSWVLSLTYLKCEKDASLTLSVTKANLRPLLLNLLCVKIESANSHAIEVESGTLEFVLTDGGECRGYKLTS